MNNMHPAGPHGTTAWLAVFNHVVTTPTRIETQRATMLVWARDEGEVRRLVDGHYRNVSGPVACYRADPQHHLNQRRVVLNITNPIMGPVL